MSVLAALAFLYHDGRGRNLPGWVPQWTGLTAKGGPQFTLEVDPDDLRRRMYETLRDDVFGEIRSQRIRLVRPLRVTDAGIEATVIEADRKTALDRLAKLWAVNQPNWADVRIDSEGTIRIAYTETRLTEVTLQIAEMSAQNIQSRLSDLGGYRLSNLGGFRLAVRQQAGKIRIQVSQSDDLRRLIVFSTKPAKLGFQLVNASVTPERALASPPVPDSELLYGQQKDDKRPYVVEKRIIISNGDLADAQARFDHRTRDPVVMFRLNTNGARRFAEATQSNVGRTFAIVLDNEVISAPIIREPIIGGQGQISGNFTVQEANELAILLRAGALPVRLRVVDQRSAEK